MFHSSPMESASPSGSIAIPLRALVIEAPVPAAPGASNQLPGSACERLLATIGALEREGRLEVEFLISPSWATLRVALSDEHFDLVQVSGAFDRDPVTGQLGLLVAGSDEKTQIVPLVRLLTERVDSAGAGLAGADGAHLADPAVADLADPAVADLADASASTRSAAEAQSRCGAPSARPARARLVIVDANAGGDASSLAGEALAQALAAAGEPAIVAFLGGLPPAARSEIIRALYQGLCDGDDLASAVAPARAILIRAGLSDCMPVVPQILGSIGGRLRLEAGKDRRASISGELPPLGTVVRGRGPLVRETVRRLQAGRVVVLHGPAGIGKSAVAAEAARRLMASGTLEAVLTVDCAAGVTAESLVGDLAASLGRLGETRLDRLVRRRMAPQHKAAALLDVLSTRRILIVLDGAEHLLAGRRPDAGSQPDSAAPSTRVSYGDPVLAAGRAGQLELLDADLGGLLYQFVAVAGSGTRVIFTSRDDFDPLAVLGGARRTGDPSSVLQEDKMVAALGGEDAPCGLLSDENPSVPVREVDGAWADRQGSSDGQPARGAQAVPSVRMRVGPLGFEAVAQVARGLPVFEALPVRAIGRAPSLRQVFELSGGRPWALVHLAAWAARSSVADVLEMLVELPGGGSAPWSAERLLARSAAGWPETARRLVSAAGLLDEPLPAAALIGIAAVNSAGVGDLGVVDLEALVAGGWLIRRDDDQGYAVNGPMRDWAAQQVAASDRPAIWRAAARHWQELGRQTAGRQAELRAWHYLDLAGDAVAADAVVQRVWEPLLTEGEVSLAVRLLGRSVATLEGLPRAMALDALSQTHHAQGDVASAADAQVEALRLYERIGDWRLVVAALQRLGRLQQLRGDYDVARQSVERALSIAEGMGDPAAAARGLRQLGVIEQLAGRPEAALACFERALRCVETAEDRAEAMKILNQLAMFHELCGDDARAILRYEQALAVAATFGDAATMAGTLHQLGLLQERAGDFDRAQTCYERSLALADKLDDPSGAALSLHQLGLLHRLRGDDASARTCFQRSLAIGRRLGALSGVAGNLYQIGLLDELQGRCADARTHYAGALAAAEDAGDRVGMARALGRLGPLWEEDGAYDQAVACAVRSMIVLNQMGSPDRDVAAGMLVRLRRCMAPESYEQAFKSSLRAGGGTAG